MQVESRSKLAAMAPRVLSIMLVACAAAEVGEGKEIGAGGRKRDGGGVYDPGFKPDAGLAPATTNCGDGVRTSDEACDDGNRMSGDGCIANCLGVEPGYSCVPAGM